MKEIKKKAAQAIVNIFEAGTPYGDYGRVTLLPGDSGHLTYGRSQTTLASGNLYLLIKSYCNTPGAELADELSGFLPRLEDIDLSLDHNIRFRRLLREAGSDPVMQEVQDNFFDRVYWEPAFRTAEATGIKCELGVSVVYDSFIHGSWHTVKRLTDQEAGPISEIGENNWVAEYVMTRRNWLATHPNPLLHSTVYRMDSFRQIITTQNWTLELPFVVRGILIDRQVLTFAPSARAEDKTTQNRLLKLRAPYITGEDVTALQEALKDKGFELEADGVFGPETEKTLKKFQEQAGLEVDGICGPATRSALGLG